MAVNATLNLALDRTSGRFSVDEGSTRLYVYDAAIDLSVGGWTRDEVAIGQDGKTMYEPYFQIVCGGMVLAEAKLNGVENPEEGEDEYFMTGTLSTNTVQMAAMFCGCAASETMRQFEARIFSTTSANPIATGRVSVWSFPSGGSNPANLPSASEALAALRTDLDNHTENEDIHVTAQEKAAWTGKQNALTFDSAPTEDSQNPVTSGGVKAALDAEAQARVQNDTALGNAISAEATARHAADDELGEDIAEERNRAEGEENRIQGDLNTHKENLTIHVTGTDKTNWNAKVDPTTLLGYVNGAGYDEDLHRILFKHDNTTVAWVSAAPFIVDGMVDNVYISGSYLVITFNTDAGKQAININLTDIFNPENYYDKTAADARFVQKETGKGLSTNDYTDADKAKVDGALQKSGGTMTGALSVNYHPGQSGQSVVTLGDGEVTIGSADINAQYQADRITRKYLGNSVDLLLPSASGTIALTADATLAPVYAATTSSSSWSVTSDSPFPGPLVLRYDDGAWEPGYYDPDTTEWLRQGAPKGTSTSASISWSVEAGEAGGNITATRTDAPVGYYLGSDQTKILTPKEVADALAASVAAKYAKPSGGIPATDLAAAVQTSLGKADTALQTHQQLGVHAEALHWEISSAATDLTIDWDTPSEKWVLKQNGVIACYEGEGNAESLSLYWAAADNTLGVDVTATRQMAGWVLGTQTDKPLATAAQGALAQTAVQPSALPASETWTFEVDDGQGGTTTVTKSVAVYAAGGNA